MKTTVTDMDVEFELGGDGHPLKTEIALDLEGFEVAREHELSLIKTAKI